MPVTQSAKKALLKDRRRTLVNARVRQQLKQILKETREKPSSNLLKQAVRILDRAAKKKVIHNGKADRLKSRLTKLVKKQSTEKRVAKPRKKSV